MNNSISIILGAILVGLVILDIVVFGGSNLVFLGKKLLELISYIAFWR